ncbi:hypothetical protein JTE90_004563 [Oedothorax gibbosus]|uniref:CAP-Gly domain-containing protein n=1 Tax=Oedothorax gibbosus TaxID=931172 RepID=A0AAV6UL68_9ARAC|nr:hypothetical protein JTE90_004563 [Oedothorax gibbosus]
MYGVILNEAKGKYSGTIDDVCYFECPKNHATFVRACQLKKDSDNFSAKKILPMYPNYLKGSSSKLGLKTISNHGSKIDIVSSSITEKNFTKLPELDNSKTLKLSEHGSNSLQRSSYNGDSIILERVGERKKDTFDNNNGNLRKVVKAMKLTVLKNKLFERNQNIELVHTYLRKLKAYLKWIEDIKMKGKNDDLNIKNFLNYLVDSMLKKLEEIVDQIPNNKNTMNTTKDGLVISEENNFLRLYIDVLEKRNEVLYTSLSHVKNMLERAWNRSCSKKLYDGVRRFDRIIEKEGKQCSSQSLKLNDVLEHETRLFLKSKPTKTAKEVRYPNKELEELPGSEKIKAYLDSLLPYNVVTNQTHNDFHSDMKKEIDNHNKDLQEVSHSENNGIHQRLSQSLTVPDISLMTEPLKLKTFSGNQKLGPKTKIRSNFILRSQKDSKYVKNENTSAKDIVDPTFELKEFISALRTKLFDANQSMDKAASETEKKKVSKMEMNKYNVMVGSSSNSSIELRKNQSLNSSKFKLERNTKRSRSESTRRSKKREAFQ